MTDAITFTVALPPRALRSNNSRYRWFEKMRARQEYSGAVWEAFLDSDASGKDASCPWQRARITYTWRYCGTAPDISNLGANTKALQDFLCTAPNTGKMRPNNCTYLGLVEDDKGVEPVYVLERVRHRGEEGVIVKVERL